MKKTKVCAASSSGSLLQFVDVSQDEKVLGKGKKDVLERFVSRSTSETPWRLEGESCGSHTRRSVPGLCKTNDHDKLARLVEIVGGSAVEGFRTWMQGHQSKRVQPCPRVNRNGIPFGC